MKKLLPALLLCFSISAFCQSSSVDEKFGFKDIKFESSIKDLAGRVQIKLNYKDSVISSYDITEPSYLKVGECPLSGVTINCFHDKIYSIKITTGTAVESSCILNVLNELYGKGTQSNQFMPKYVWNGNKVSVIYDQNEVNGKASITLYGLALKDLAMEYFKTQTKSSTKDF